MVRFMRLSKPFFLFKALIFVAGLSLFFFFVCVCFFVFSPKALTWLAFALF